MDPIQLGKYRLNKLVTSSCVKKEGHTARLSNFPATVSPEINCYYIFDFMVHTFNKAFKLKLLLLKSATKKKLVCTVMDYIPTHMVST